MECIQWNEDHFISGDYKSTIPSCVQNLLTKL